jgi:hypothetical protein
MIEVKIERKLGLTMISRLVFTLIFGVIAASNPSPTHYKNYATNYLVKYLQENICTTNSKKIKHLWQRECQTLVTIGYPYIGQMIQRTTTRQNFIFFSVYQTDLIFPSPIPSYEFETIAIMDKFYTYESGEL